MLERTRF